MSEKSETKSETKKEAAASSGKPLMPKAESRGKIYDSVLDTIGNTPLVRLPRFSEKHELHGDILAKLEYFNPLASEKDRVALAMIEAAERAGKIKPGETTLVEPTSGNAGVSLAFVAAAKGYKLILVVSQSVALERRKLLGHLGAELIFTPVEGGMKAAVARAKEIVEERDNAVILDQFENPANAQIHAETTGEEIWADTGGKVDIVIAGVGTGGTITGLARSLKAHNKDIKIYAVEPTESAVLSGGEPGAHKIQGIGAGFVPPLFDAELVDNVITVNSQTAIDTAREAALLDGIACGISSGAALAAAKAVAGQEENKGKMIVVIVPSFAERYISTPLFEGQD